MLNILYAKRDKDSKAFCREGSKRIDFTNTKRQCRVKSVELLKLQYTELTHMPSEIRIKGVSLARDTETIIPFIQPLTPEHNKNVWEGCAVIIAEKSDEDLKPYLVELLGWLQDMNWPGAFCILNRLQRYADNNSLRDAINICIEKARKCRNEVWEGNLCLLLHKH